MIPQATLRLLERQKRLNAATQALVLREWRKLSHSGDWLASWQVLLPRAVAMVSLAQMRAASMGAESVPAVLEEMGDEPGSLHVVPRAFAGWMQPDASPYQVPLAEALLTAPVVRARQFGALESGAWMLSALTQQAVAAAGRGATQAEIASRKDVEAVFVEPGGACQRCAVLVGKRMPYHAEFQRHPRCDGQIMAINLNRPNPVSEFSVDEITDLTRWQRQAIADGADLNQVLNAHSPRGGGRSPHSPLYANGTRTWAGSGRGRRKRERLTPKGIYQIAGDDRDMAVTLLRREGYLLGP